MIMIITEYYYYSRRFSSLAKIICKNNLGLMFDIEKLMIMMIVICNDSVHVSKLYTFSARIIYHLSIQISITSFCNKLQFRYDLRN
jgi:hypothetical protein